MKIIATTQKASQHSQHKDPIAGFPKVVAGGRIIRIDSSKPYLERMVTGHDSNANSSLAKENKSKDLAALETITANLNAGIKFVDRQETSLAKIGGKLSGKYQLIGKV